MSQGVTVLVVGSDRTVAFAAREACRYLGQMTGRTVQVVRARAYESGAPGIWVGRESDLAGRPASGDEPDSVLVRARGGHVVLSGPNGRSVLYAVYRYLEALGCAWLRPGRDGERVPRGVRPFARRLDIRETASYPHRCICIEGSCSVEHVKAMIDYAAKRGFNAYFTQFRNSFTFFDRWYGLEKNRGPVRTRYTSAQAVRATEAVKREALRRGFMLHVVGHGWTCEPLGVSGEEWAPTKQRIPARASRCFAQVNGKRALWGGIPLNTQLCMSSPTVQRLMVEAVADYAETHPKEGIIHVWLADGVNNHCECPRCRPHRPSDLYVRILNGIDAELGRRGLATRIVFLAYVDLLWAPEREKLANPGRFILMFAPITRTYRSPLLASGGGKVEPVGPYRRNRLEFPASTGANVRLLRGWERAFRGEMVDFDYHLWRAQHFDPGQVGLARILQRDVADLHRLGMGGLISCQIQRVAFPTGLYLDVMGRTLWNRRERFDDLARRHLREVFGASGPAVRAYLERLTRLCWHEIPPERGTAPAVYRAAVARALRGWSCAPEAVAAFRPQIRAGLKARDAVTRAAWELLEVHAWYVTTFAELYSKARRRDPAATALYSAAAAELERRLPQIHHVLDTHMVKGLFQHALAVNGLPFEERIVVKRKRG